MTYITKKTGISKCNTDHALVIHWTMDYKTHSKNVGKKKNKQTKELNKKGKVQSEEGRQLSSDVFFTEINIQKMI